MIFLGKQQSFFMKKNHHFPLPLFTALPCFLVLPFVLSGCQPLPADHLQQHTRQGSFISMWEEISPAESKVSIMVERGYVKARRAKYNPYRNLYSQAFLLANGSMVYEQQSDVPKDAVLTPTEQIVQRYNKHNELIAGRINIAEEDIVKKTTEQGDIYYTYLESPDFKCYVFFRYSDDSQLSASYAEDEEGNHYQAITGSFCGNAATADAATLEGEMLQFITSVRFDNGDHTRRQILQSAISDTNR
jgi:hypothetical protein